MANPFQDIVDGIVEALAADGQTQLLHAEEYNGQSFEDLQVLVRDRGPAAFVRLVEVGEAEGPRSARCALVRVELIVAAPKPVRDSAAAEVWKRLWQATDLLVGSTCDIAQLAEAWRFGGAMLREQEPDVAVASVFVVAHAHLEATT